VEQKNWSVVRRTVGYHRYDTGEQLDTLNRLYAIVRLYTNFFQPSMKLVEKTRIGSKLTKRYDKPQTPYQRLLGSEQLPAQVKYHLSELYEALNPAQLQRDISSLQERLHALVLKQSRISAKEVTPPTNFEYISADATN
jgi:hypothetical protein